MISRQLAVKYNFMENKDKLNKARELIEEFKSKYKNLYVS